MEGKKTNNVKSFHFDVLMGPRKEQSRADIDFFKAPTLQDIMQVIEANFPGIPNDRIIINYIVNQLKRHICFEMRVSVED